MRSMGKVYALGHRLLRELFADEVVVQEKVDGSQFNFGVTDTGHLWMRSKGAEVHDYETAPDLFKPALVTVLELFAADQLGAGWTYRAEAVCRPRHNVLTYGRVPTGGMILFDIEAPVSGCLSPEHLAEEAQELGLECVPSYGYQVIDDPAKLYAHLDKESCLGGCRIEGVVIKNYFKPDPITNTYPLMGKLVSKAFKEQHRGVKYGQKPKSDAVEELALRFGVPARFQKAVQRLAEAGKLDDSPRDIGPLIKLVQDDVEEECADDIKEALYSFYWPHIRRAVARDVPQWYKDKLEQFQPTEEVAT